MEKEIESNLNHLTMQKCIDTLWNLRMPTTAVAGPRGLGSAELFPLEFNEPQAAPEGPSAEPRKGITVPRAA